MNNNLVNTSTGLDLSSVLVYLLFFLSSFFFCYISEYLYKKKKQTFGHINAFICIFILCLLAALRSTSVGGDINVYLLPNFKNAISFSSFREFYEVSSAQMEILFSFLVYLIAKVGNLQLLFFIIQLLILLPLYMVLYENRNNCSITVGFIVYIFLFYNFSLSGMRQSIAMSMMFLASKFLFRKDYKKFVFWGIISTLFHKGAVIPLLFVFFIVLFENKKSYRKLLFTISTFFIIFFVFYNQFVTILIKIFWLINPRYSYYIVTYLSDSIQWSNIPTTEIILKFGIVVLCLIFGYYRDYKNVNNLSILFFSLIGRYFVLLNSRMYESLRIAYYFDIFSISLVGNTVYQQKLLSNKKVIAFCLILLAFLYWIYFIMYIGGYNTKIFVFS